MSTLLYKTAGGRRLTLGMFFAFTRSSTSNRTSIGTPNSNRSLMIRSTRSRVFIWSVGAALCFLPRGVGQLLNMTSSMILGVRKHQTVLVNKGPERLTFHPAASQCTLQYHKFFSSPGREGGRGHISQDIQVLSTTWYTNSITLACRSDSDTTSSGSSTTSK